MCEPTTLIAISTVTSMIGQIDAANKQADAFEANNKQANIAKVNEDAQNREIFIQQQQDAASDSLDINKQTLETSARAQVAAGDSGAYDNTGGIMQDIMRQGLEETSNISQNVERQERQQVWQNLGSKSRAQSRINSVSKPSTLGTIASVTATGASGAADYRAAEST